MKQIFLDYQPYGITKKYDVWFYNNFPKNLPKKRINYFPQMLVIYDEILPEHLIVKIKTLLIPFSKNIESYPFTCGSKSLTSLSKIWEKMVDFVPDVLVGVGGGTISDLVGLASATYQRGISDILFPTTPLGMVDASLGGKTAIDFHHVKNSIGRMHYPLAVINILEMMKTLPKDEFISGFSEAVKGAVIFDKHYFEELENNVQNILTFNNSDKLCEIFAQAAKLKMLNAEAPSNHKIKLLYGHAIGHAIEVCSNDHFRHGDAVSIGMTIEGAMACLLKYWDIEEWRRQTKLLLNLSLPIKFPNTLNVDSVFNRMSLYKKLVRDGKYGFIFPSSIGNVVKQRDGYVTYIPISKAKKLFEQAITLINSELSLMY